MRSIIISCWKWITFPTSYTTYTNSALPQQHHHHLSTHFSQLNKLKPLLSICLTATLPLWKREFWITNLELIIAFGFWMLNGFGVLVLCAKCTYPQNTYSYLLLILIISTFMWNKNWSWMHFFLSGIFINIWVFGICWWKYRFIDEQLIFVMNLLGFCRKGIIVLTFKKIKD